jgi:polysaccharide biosynthesis/export protein
MITKSNKTGNWLIFVLIAVLFAFSSCATLVETQPEDLDLALPHFEMDTQHGFYDNETPYLLGPDDVVKVEVEQHPEWSGDFAVKPNGRISIPDLEDMEVEDTSTAALEKNLVKYLSKYIENPKVKVEIVKYASQVVYVLGEVNKPGKYSTEGKSLTLRDAIVLAGLPTEFAQDNNVFIISASRKIPRKKVVNLYRVLYRGELQRDIKLKPGDIVYVPQNLLGKISRVFSVLLSPLSSARGALIP